MGLGDRLRERKQRAAEAEARAAHDAWASSVQELRDRLDVVRTWFGADGSDPQAAGVLTKAGEHVYAVLEGAALIEPRRAPGQYAGGSQGVSFRVAKGVHYRVGAMRGTYVPGPESPTPIDTGRAVITDQRVTFAGLKASREWQYAKLLACQHDPDNWTVLPVSNRQKASGIGYDAEQAEDVRFRLDLAVATYMKRRPGLERLIQSQLDQLLTTEPARPVGESAVIFGERASTPQGLPAAPTQLPPADWYPDNADGTLQRYWDGTQWTEHTAPR